MLGQGDLLRRCWVCAWVYVRVGVRALGAWSQIKFTLFEEARLSWDFYARVGEGCWCGANASWAESERCQCEVGGVRTEKRRSRIAGRLDNGAWTEKQKSCYVSMICRYCYTSALTTSPPCWQLPNRPTWRSGLCLVSFQKVISFGSEPPGNKMFSSLWVYLKLSSGGLWMCSPKGEHLVLLSVSSTIWKPCLFGGPLSPLSFPYLKLVYDDVMTSSNKEILTISLFSLSDEDIHDGHYAWPLLLFKKFYDSESRIDFYKITRLVVRTDYKMLNSRIHTKCLAL